MSLLIVIVVVFFGYNIYQKTIYTAQENDTVSVTYTVTNGEDEYTDQSAYPVFGDDTDSYPMFSDELLDGKRSGDEFTFDYELPEDQSFDSDTTTIAAGTVVTIDARISGIAVYQEESSEESDSSTSEDTSSSEESETTSSEE